MFLPSLLLALAGQAAATVLFDNSTMTSQVRVAFHGDTGMVVSWNTFEQLDNPTVLYGLSASSLTESASSNVSVTYNTSITYNNHVWIEGLQADTEYYYQPQHMIANENVYGPYTFKTARSAGDHSPYTVAFVCDLGTMGSLGLSNITNKKTDPEEVLQTGEKNTIDSLVDLIDTYDFVVHPGDLAYADYWLKMELADYITATIADGPTVYENILNEFYDEMEAITAYKPYMIGVGNHEADCDNGGTGSYDASVCVEGQTNFTGVINHFRMPSDISGGVGNFWYSFDYGMVHYVYFNTETDLGNGLLQDEQTPYFAGPFGSYPNEQVDWLAADLAAVNRCDTPWVVALGHRPWFSSGDQCANCSTAFAKMFETYGVDVVLQGHFHVYERNYPVFANGTVDPNGYENPSSPWYLINGIAGHWDGMDVFTDPIEDYQAYGLDEANATYGWSRLHFYNATHVRHEFIASNNNSVLDTNILYKEHTCSSSPSSTASSLLVSSTSAVSSRASSIGSVYANSSTSASFGGASSIPPSNVSYSGSASVPTSALPSVSASASASASQSLSSAASASSIPASTASEPAVSDISCSCDDLPSSSLVYETSSVISSELDCSADSPFPSLGSVSVSASASSTPASASASTTGSASEPLSSSFSSDATFASSDISSEVDCSAESPFPSLGSVSASASASSTPASASASATGSASSKPLSFPSSSGSVASASSSGSATAPASSSGSATTPASISGSGAAASASTSGSATTASSSQYTTSTILSTTTYTITSCAPTVTNCPVGKVTTEVVTQYTTYCPESETATGTGSVADSTKAVATSTPVAASSSLPVASGSGSASFASVGSMTTAVPAAVGTASVSTGSTVYNYNNSTGAGTKSVIPGTASLPATKTTTTALAQGSSSTAGSSSATVSGTGSESSTAAAVTAGAARVAKNAGALLAAVMLGAVILL